ASAEQAKIGEPSAVTLVLSACFPGSAREVDEIMEGSVFGQNAIYTNSSSLTTHDRGPARGHTEVPQVERMIVVHFAGRMPLLDGIAPGSCPGPVSSLRARAYMASGPAA
ncbi:hypothetical protein M9458_015189, partial [Cirrhinus mrigala]